MDFNKLEELRRYAFSQLGCFYNEFKFENSNENSFENWNARDVLGHLTWWLRFAGTKLEYIKNNKDHSGVTNLGEFNENTFNSYKNISINIVYNELKSAMAYFSEMIKLYTINELSSKDFPIGFKYELWRYMDLHLFIHHIMHILFYYLKKDNIELFVKIINERGKDILEYNGIGVLLYKDYFNNKTIMEQQFTKLKEYNNNTKNKIIEEIIKINME